MDRIADRLILLAGGKMLDVATGRGGFAQYLIENFANYDELIGIDISTENIRIARQNLNHGRIELVVMDGSAMAFPDKYFDTVSIANSLHHLQVPGQVLAEMKRVLKPGGNFIILEMYRDNLSEKQMTHALLHHWWASVDRARGIVHNETYTRTGLVNLIKALELSDADLFEAFDPGDFSDPLPEEITEIKSICDKYLETARNLGRSELVRQGESLKARIDTVGYAGASELALFGKK
ncbi:putative Ubiquinone-menaquinone biosynthesis methyltransferase protein [Candidatus Zixiibacteriota bacterium]|nr:putative Ubiquinone-menaquinone biosynthesis methyltransferase protein [candidate division Zixibacteria bacterium]